MATRADKSRQRQNAVLLSEILERKGGLLRNQARKHAARFDEVDDILQRAYELFIERFDDPYEALPWLNTTIKREAWGLRRRAYRRYEIPICTTTEDGEGGYDLAECLPDQARGPSELLADRDRDEQLRELVRTLKPDERTALGLRALGYSYREIAALHGWTYTKVNRAISEGRATLREMRRGEGGVGA